MDEIKPILRGRIHQFAFYKTLVLYIISIIVFAFFRKFSYQLLIYFASQLLLYGVSSFYHLTKFTSEKIRRLFQKLDHSSIFILIAGTQTGVFMSLKTKCMELVILTWLISVVGILRIFVFTTIVQLLDVVIYIVHGICVVPFFNTVRSSLGVFEMLLFICGGSLYITGGIIFGIEKPVLCPRVFGYHELFHLLTVLANMCFMVVILVLNCRPLFKH